MPSRSANPPSAELNQTETAILRLAAIVEYSDDAIIGKDLNSIVTSWNKGAEKIFGYTADEMIGTSIMRLIPSDRHDEENQILGKIKQGQNVEHFETLRLTKDGRLIDVSVTASPIKDADGKPIGVSKVARDITERKRAEQKLSLLNICVSNLNDIVLITEADPIDEPGPRIVFVNEAFKRLTGYTSTETLGRSPRFLQGEKTDRRVLKEIRDALAQQKPIRRQILNYGKDGTAYWLDMDIVPIFDPAGKCTHFAAIERDITEAKKNEEQLFSKTALSEAQLNSTLDGILVVGGNGKKILQNQRMVDLWKLPRDFAEEVEDRQRLEWVTNQVKNPRQFADKVAWLYAHPDEISRDELELIDGRFFDRYSAPVRGKDGKHYGRIWTFRDITERKRAEEALRSVSSGESGRSQKRVLWDLAVIIVLSVLVFVTCYQLGLSDESIQYIASHDKGAGTILDEANFTLIFLCLAMLVFSYRRWRESQTEILSQTQISRALGLLNKEMEEQVRQRTAQLAQTNENLRHEIAERQRAEAVIKQFPAIIESTDDAIISKTLDRSITSWNPAAERMFGYAASEIIGKPITLLFPPDRLQEETAILARITRGERIRNFETVRVRKDGRLLDVSATISPIKDAEGKITGVSKIVRDITERKQAELALKEGELRYRSLFENMLGGYAYCQVLLERDRVSDFIYLAVNRAFEELTGLKDVVGKKISEVIPGIQQTNPELFDLYTRVVLTGRPEKYELQVKPLGRWFSISVYCNQEKERFTIVFDNITDRKQADEKIAEQAAFMDKAQDAILVRDLEGNIRFWNHGAERMYGWTRDEVVGRNIGGLLYTDPKIFEKSNGVAISQGEWHGELQHLTKDRGEITIEARWTLIRDNEGRPKSVLAINTDITEKKKIEAQFMRAQRMESIGTLAGGVAHDLNNILAPIMMSIDLLKTLSDNPLAMQMLETIEVSAKRGADIVRQVLSFARGLEGERVEVQPKHLLKDLESIIKDTFPKDIRLKFVIPNDIWTILGDPTQIHQILLNLCVNARDAMPNGGNLTVRVENSVLDEQYAAMNIQAKPGRYVNIGVTDSGTGMTKDIIDKIFEPFFTTKDLNKGTGLGLSTVMAIVKSHEGLINVYSEPGKGTTFNVYLPAIETSSAGRTEPAEAASLPRGNGETVLVVDDEASILTITSQTVQAFGYRILTATDGADAVAIYAQHRHEIALVLTDMSMPILDGPAMIHALMRINPAVKIIAASGLNENVNAAKMAGVGIKHFLTKPYTAGTLLKTLRTVLDEA
jgi:PAS domain S-box-containing protein